VLSPAAHRAIHHAVGTPIRNQYGVSEVHSASARREVERERLRRRRSAA
jgi:hypothetical protein